MSFDGYLIDTDGIYGFYVNNKGNITNQRLVCERFDVVKSVMRVKNISDSIPKFTTVLEIPLKDGTNNYVRLANSLLASSPIKVLSNEGLNSIDTRDNNEVVSEVIRDIRKTLDYSYDYDTIGFISHKGKELFVYSEVVPSDSSIFVDENTKPRSKGTFEEWKDNLSPFISERPELQLALAMGASAPVVAKLKNCGIFSDSIIWGIVGMSSQGKTSALKLSASVWHGADIATGDIRTMLDTENFFFGELAGRYGVPYFVDEASSSKEDQSKRIYQISMNHDRGRCKPDGTPKVPKSWLGAVTFTSETSLFGQSNNNSGLYARLVEFSFRWTKDKKSADEMLKAINKYYGTAWKPFVTELMNVSNGDLELLYIFYCEELNNKVSPKTGVEERIIQRLAILLITVDVMIEAWDIKFDKEAIIKLLVDTFKENISRIDRVDAIYEDLLQYIVMHRAQFPDKSENSTVMFAEASKTGSIEKRKDRKCAWILADFVAQFFSGKGLTLNKDVKKELYNRGYIERFGDKYQKYHTISNLDAPCICFFIDKQPSNDKEPDKKPVVKKTTSNLAKANSKINLLLSEDEDAC